MKTFKEKFYSVAVSDFDGTLLRSDRTLSDFSINTIENFTKNGGIFCICTGRMTASIMDYCKKYNFGDYVISYNGAEIVKVKTGEKIYKNHVDNDACIKLLQYAEKNKITVQIYPNDQLLVEKSNDMIKSYSNIVKVPINECNRKVSQVFKEEGYTSAKVLFYTNDSCADKMLSEIKSILGDEYNVARSNEFHIDVMKKGVTKGETLLKFVEILNLDKEKLITFGDERNDISLLKVANLGVACANANSELKEIADYVTDSCDEDGVAKALIKFGI